MTKSIDEYTDWRYVAETVFATTYNTVMLTDAFFNHDVILQRFYATRVVYNEFYRHIEMVELKIEELPEHIIIFLHADNNTLLERVKKSLEQKASGIKVNGRLEKYMRIQIRMKEYLSKLVKYDNVKVISIDTSKMSIIDYNNFCQSFMYGTVRDLLNSGKKQITFKQEVIV